MSKKIDAALKDLKKALEAHADVVGGSAVSLKKAQRASAKVAEAASAYADAVHSKSGLTSPFGSLITPGLEESTLASLTAERDSLKEHMTGAVSQHGLVEVAATQAEPIEDGSDDNDSDDNDSDDDDSDESDSDESDTHENRHGHNDEDHDRPHA